MTNEPTNKYKELEDRMISFSKQILTFCRNNKTDPLLQPLLLQLVRSATSIGANYSEANNASSKMDFRNKVFIAKKEAAETKYWLVVLAGELQDETGLLRLQNECQSLLMILQKIISSLRNNTGKSLEKGEM